MSCTQELIGFIELEDDFLFLFIYHLFKVGIYWQAEMKKHAYSNQLTKKKRLKTSITSRAKIKSKSR